MVFLQTLKDLPMTLGDPLHSQQRDLAAEDGQEHPPMRGAYAALHVAIRQGLEETDAIGGAAESEGADDNGSLGFPRTTP
jgi:hypothetical protein